MKVSYETDLYARIRQELDAVAMIDCHEHLQREREFPTGDDVHVGLLFLHYAPDDLIAAGMPMEEMARVRPNLLLFPNPEADPSLSPEARWRLLEPWYRKAWNTGYCEALRIAIRDLYGIDEFSESTMTKLTEAMRGEIRPGFTRKVFDKAGIDFAMQSPLGPGLVFNPDYNFDCFICDMCDAFTGFPIPELAQQADMDILCLDDYLKVIDFYFERDARCACAFKVARAYDRTLFW
ncbi:MAG TPA: hypothetical protein HPP77_00560, partial [Candidatus Hydrogenedentes bacterium]|nr:hypothetical protein [Candidatus Hydrogenedentota bacterium]